MASEDDFVQMILQHEGLVPGQTPFRITSPAMRGWKTVQGYEVDPSRKVRGRENFLFLKNPMEVAPAVRRQFRNYMQFPTRYGLPPQPTVGQALSVFDQTGAQGKADYLRSRGININAPLASLFQEAS